MLSTCSPPPGAYTAKPFSVAEIDAHIDCTRIWATLMQQRGEVDAESEKEINRSYEECNELEEGLCEIKYDVRRALDIVDGWMSPIEKLAKIETILAGIVE